MTTKNCGKGFHFRGMSFVSTHNVFRFKYCYDLLYIVTINFCYSIIINITTALTLFGILNPVSHIPICNKRIQKLMEYNFIF